MQACTFTPWRNKEGGENELYEVKTLRKINVPAIQLSMVIPPFNDIS
jgi:hypothetical protein